MGFLAHSLNALIVGLQSPNPRFYGTALCTGYATTVSTRIRTSCAHTSKSSFLLCVYCLTTYSVYRLCRLHRRTLASLKIRERPVDRIDRSHHDCWKHRSPICHGCAITRGHFKHRSYINGVIARCQICDNTLPDCPIKYASDGARRPSLDTSYFQI